MEFQTNPFAPPAFEGVVSRGADFVDQAFTYVYDVTLTASQALTGAVVSLDRDADFLLEALQLVKCTSGNFTFKLYDNQGQQFSNAPLYGGVLQSGSSFIPFPFIPARIFAAGGSIKLDLTDYSGASNTIQLAFRGIKRKALR